ncbi:peptidoglycan DD-metalloendopeptidase family protein [Patescibacteria group bacterium]
MKKLASISLLLFLFAQTAIANTPIKPPDQVERGRTFQVDIPKYENESITGLFGDKEIKFFEVERAPKWDEYLSRAEFLKLFFDNHLFEHPNLELTGEFPDVSDENPFKEYIQKAHALGMVNGYENGNFGPYDPISRAHIAKILVEGLDPESKDPKSVNFPDVSPDDWHYEYIQKAIETGIFQGYPDGYMRPDRYINFDEAKIVLQRTIAPDKFKEIENKAYFRGYVGIHRTSESGERKLIIKTDSEQNYDVNVLNRQYPTEYIQLTPQKNELFASDKIDNTWELINGAKAAPHPEQLWEDKFIVPTDGILTLGFGDTIYINGAFSGSHFGLDYANVEGTEIYASNTGIVTLAEETMSYGNTVVIDHGQNVFTMYLHCASLDVQKGDRVSKGDLIAKMGSTGIATGSHLHFTVFVGDIIVDNYEWLDGKF